MHTLLRLLGAACALSACLLPHVGATRTLAFTVASDGRTKTDAPPPNLARLVLSGRDFAPAEAGIGLREPVLVVGEAGAILGEVPLGTWIRVDVPPGPRTLIAFHRGYVGPATVAALCGDFAAGATYFVAVGTRRIGVNVQAPALSLDTSPEALGGKDVALLVGERDRAGVSQLLDDELRGVAERGAALARGGECARIAADQGRRFL